MRRFKLKAQDLERQLARTQALQRVIADISAELDLARILDRVIGRLGEAFEADRVAIFLRQTETGQLIPVASKGLSAAYLTSTEKRINSGIGMEAGLMDPLCIPDTTDPAAATTLPPDIAEEGFRSFLLLPLIFASDALGILMLYYDQVRIYDEDDLSMAFAFANQLAIAVRNASSFERERKQAEALNLSNHQLAALLRTSSFLIEGNDLSEQLKLIASTIKETAGFDIVKIMVVNEETETIEMAAGIGLKPEAELPSRQKRAPLAEEEFGRLFREEHRVSSSYLACRSLVSADGGGVTDSNSSDRLRYFAGGDYWQQGDALLVPLYLNNRRLVGMISVDKPVDGKVPCLETIQLLEIFAGQAAVAIRNSRLYSSLQAAVKAKDEFLSVASHELKTPLTSIMAYTQHLLQRVSTIEEAELLQSHLGVVSAQARRMARLVQELLDVSALDKGTLELDKTAIDLNELIQRAISSAQAASSKHRFESEHPTKPVIVFADKTRIRQVVDDLISNAMKYSPEGGNIQILLMRRSSEALLSISDEGVGIAKEHIPLIFERFYQVDANPRSRQFGGMGLGLFICRQLIEAHGGRIWVESKKGEGSTFFFSLPLASASTA